MIVSSITELKIITVLDRGIPNEECIAILSNERINIGQYGIMLGAYAEGNSAFPFRDHMFWFGDGFIDKDDWLFVYTGIGEPRRSKAKNEVNYIYTVFWGKSKTVFADTRIVPLLFRVDAVCVIPPPEDRPQLETEYNPTGV